MIDGHIHMNKTLEEAHGSPQTFITGLAAADCWGGVVLSIPPRSFSEEKVISSEERLEQLMELVDQASAFGQGKVELFPFFWIDPLDPFAHKQVDRAVAAGIRGFKVIPIDADPGEGPCLSIYQRIADHNKPILFHSGILWNNKNSSKYCHPAGYECLLAVEGLRFALAHVGWPWHDECLAVFGKFLQTKEMGLDQQMYVDMTPGTPEIYRREVLTKLHTIGYNVEERIFFGSDCCTDQYDANWTRRWRQIDRAIYRDLILDSLIIEKIEEKNLLTFLG